MGDVSRKCVQDGNLHAQVAAFLFALALERKLNPVLENPVNSMIFQSPALSSVLSCVPVASCICCRCAFERRRFGTRWRKPYKLVGLAWTKHLAKSCPCPGRVHERLTYSTFLGQARKTYGKHAKLIQSAAYPPAMGRWVLKQWQAHCTGGLAAQATLEKTPAWAIRVLPVPARDAEPHGQSWQQPALCPAGNADSADGQPSSGREKQRRREPSSQRPAKQSWACPALLPVADQCQWATPSLEPGSVHWQTPPL